MDIIKASISDLEDLVHISWKTFYEAFHHLNKPENMEAYLSHAFNHEKLTTELNNENSEFYFVKEDQHIIGYVKINKRDAQTEFKDDASIEIERIYIDATHQRKKYRDPITEQSETDRERRGCQVYLAWRLGKKS